MATTAYCVFWATLVGAPAIAAACASAQRLAEDNISGAVGAAMFFVPLALSAALLLLPLLCPRPRVARSAQGLSVAPAPVVGILGTAVAFTWTVVLAVVAAVCFGWLDADRRTARLLGVVALFLLGRAVYELGRIVLSRADGRARAVVTLTPSGVRFIDGGRPDELRWEDITGVRIGPSGIRGHRLGIAQLYLYTAGRESYPLMVDRYLYLGGSWLAVTIDHYRRNPAARITLAGPGTGP